MTRRLATWTLSVLLTVAGAAHAQEQATVLKRDGTRVTGRFEAWDRGQNTIYIRVSLNDQRRILLGDAAVLEVSGNADNLPANETEAARGGDHVLVLTSGEVIRGRLINIEGGQGSANEAEPRVVSFKPTAGAERRARFNEVRRLYLGNFPAPNAAPVQPPVTELPGPEQPLPPGAVRVAANAGWVSTNFTLRRTDRVQFSTAGEVRLSQDADDMAGPAGSRRGRYAPNGPAPTLLAGALIGRIGNGPAFAIGDQTVPLPMPGDGVLFLAVNDDQAGDNAGAFVVTLSVLRGRR